MLQELVGRPCVGAVAQPETDGDLLLDFGGWQDYEESPNSRLLSTERGKWSLMVCCPWRLDGPGAPVCDWRSVAHPDRQEAEEHLALEGMTVEALTLEQPGMDLVVRLSRGHVLRVFCDSEGKADECWYVIRPDGSTVTATRSFRLEFEPPKGRR